MTRACRPRQTSRCWSVWRTVTAGARGCVTEASAGHLELHPVTMLFTRDLHWHWCCQETVKWGCRGNCSFLDVSLTYVPASSIHIILISHWSKPITWSINSDSYWTTVSPSDIIKQISEKCSPILWSCSMCLLTILCHFCSNFNCNLDGCLLLSLLTMFGFCQSLASSFDCDVVAQNHFKFIWTQKHVPTIGNTLFKVKQ